MRLIAVTLALVALSLTSADATHRYHHRHYHSMAARHNPNGTAGGPTTVSGTGSSQYGGSTPGVTGKN